jgi:hypothetical protein
MTKLIKLIETAEDLDPVSKLVVARDLVRQIMVECPPSSDLDKSLSAAKLSIENAWKLVENDVHSVGQEIGSGWREDE